MKNYLKYFHNINLENINIIMKENFNMKREKNKQIKQKHNIFETHIIENFKKYYNIDDHTDLIMYIKKHITNSL